MRHLFVPACVCLMTWSGATGSDPKMSLDEFYGVAKSEKRVAAEPGSADAVHADIPVDISAADIAIETPGAETQSLDDWLASLPAGRLLIFCDEDAKVADPVAALRSTASGEARQLAAPVSLLIGPEGGFDDVERAQILRRQGVLRLSLGPRILRADTAAVAALALVQSVLGDWL